MWTLFVWEQDWWRTLLEATDWMQQELSGYGPSKSGPLKFDLPGLFQCQQQTLKSWLYKAVQHSTAAHAVRVECLQWHHELFLLYQQQGLQAKYPEAVIENDISRQVSYACFRCRLLFKNKTAWAVHAFKVHQRVNNNRFYAEGTVCEGCLKQYHTPTRLFHHLCNNAKCAKKVRNLRTAQPLGPGRGNKREVMDRELKVPAQRISGPPQPEPDLEPNDEEPLDDTLLEYFATAIDSDDYEPDAENLVQQIRAILLMSVEEIHVVRRTLQKFLEELEQQGHHWLEEDLLQAWSHACRMALSRFSLVWQLGTDVRQAVEDDDEIRRSAWLFCKNHPDSAWKWDSTEYVPRFRVQELVFLHLFSGARRDGDLEFHLHQLQLPAGYTLVVLSVDIIFDSVRGNLSDPAIQRQWIDFLRRGLIVGFLAGPPCETWTMARLLGGLPGHFLGDGGPRLVRTAEEAYGLPKLRYKEQLQFRLGNSLLFFVLQFMAEALYMKRFGIMDHPSTSDQDAHAWLASVWQVALVRMLINHPAAQCIRVLQGFYEGESPKPTTLLVSCGRDIPVQEFFDNRRVTKLPPAIVMGKTQGSYHTAVLKEYPPAFCRVIAELFGEWLWHYTQGPVQGSLPADFLAHTENLRAHFNEAAARGPDCAGLHVNS